MATRLRFRCQHKGTNIGYGENKFVGTVKLGPVMPDQNDPAYEEMKQFYTYTPGGQIEFATINERALAEFEVGKDYYITLEPAT